MSNRTIAEGVASMLSLNTPPIGLAFVEAAPKGVETFNAEVPSACTLWRRAESQVFYAAAEKHFNCPIGAMTMGFDLPKEVGQQLSGLVQMMCDCGYISGEEPAKIPGVKKKKSGIVYGPLKDFPLEPDLVLMWLPPRQAMLYNEAVGSIRWTSTLPATVFGRPACAALPISFENSQSALSLGCTGMRTFTDIGQDRLLAALPGNKASELLNALTATLKSNATMREFYEQHKARFS